MSSHNSMIIIPFQLVPIDIPLLYVGLFKHVLSWANDRNALFCHQHNIIMQVVVFIYWDVASTLIYVTDPNHCEVLSRSAPVVYIHIY